MAHILLVEDDVELALLTAEFLRTEGHYVEINHGNQVVLDTTAWPDLMLLDVELPGETGFVVCKNLRRRGYAGPILFLTARHSPTDERLAFEFGADDFMRKPVDPRVLLHRIHAALRRAEPKPPPRSPRAR